ncbi:uncharacterized protein LOC110998534 isoform X1 [Pieris rapae]|uniref:uncharacterized protein LOC110998534 isoform X1 n=2 Tax=Pieris rapae TaxID=64459 RepID=UPI001E2800DC|nr:uncharacterized protein LOC110998534 isoform X1 [Pieris rapae]
MAEKQCCIENCTSSSSRNEDVGVTYHKFPKDLNIYNSWIRITHTRPNTDNNLYVCSRHFCKSDFQMYQESKYVLKSGALPSIFPWTMAEGNDFSEAHIGSLFQDDHNDNVNTSNSIKESDPENIESIKKFIEGQHKHHKMTENEDNLNTLSNLNLSVTALDVIHKSQETPIIANSVMNMIIDSSNAKVKKKEEIQYNVNHCDKGTVSLKVGSKVEAKDFGGQWHAASIVEVDYDEVEVLVHYENSTNMQDEWISVRSSRLRPYKPNWLTEVAAPNMPPKTTGQSTEILPNDEIKVEEKKKVTFIEGERCLARWRDNKRFMATIQNDLGNGQYEIVFDDGFQWKCSVTRLHKLKDSSGKPFENLSVETSISPSTSALSPQSPGIGPLSKPAFHTHLFDPTRDYLGSKSERREMKRKLNIKEIFNIGQKKRKIKPENTEPKSVKKKIIIEPKPLEIKKELPDAVASIIGTVDGKVLEDTKLESPESNDEGGEKITLDDLITSKDEASYLSDSDAANRSDPVSNEEDTLEKFDDHDGSINEEVIDKMKEVISKLEDGLNKVESKEDVKDTPEPEINLEVIQVDPNDVEIDIETEEIDKIVPIFKDEIKTEQTTEPTMDVNRQEKIKEKPKKLASKVKKSKKLRLLQEKKVKKQVEKVKNELEEMKKQVEEMRKQMLQKTEELATHQQQRAATNEMPVSFLLPGEWCCRWVNGEPVGQVHETVEPRADTKKPALPRRTVLVEDKRLPEGWKKVMVRRSLGQSAGKWDVVLLSPDQKRFHTKQEMRTYLDQTQGEFKAYENALLDFGVHLKLSRRMGWVTNTGPSNAPVSNVSPFVIRKKLSAKDGKKRLKIRKPNYILQRQGELGEPSEKSSETKETDIDMQNPPIENGFIYVGSLKVQVIDSLLRCPAEGCLKNFRNNTLLKMHIKHYHRELKKMLGNTPKVLDLAYARTRPTGEKIKKKVIKVKIPRVQKSNVLVGPKPEVSEPQPEIRINITPLPTEETQEDSPKLRQALIPKPVKRPKVLLPVRKPELEVSEDDKLELECVDFEAAISTHTVTKPGDFQRLEIKPAFSEDEEWPSHSDVDTRSSFPGSGTPDSKILDKVATPIPGVSSESNEEAKEGELYMFTETGERIKIERMKREEIINCHCGFREEDGLMVQCELCLCWQHALCHNIHTEGEVPEKYTCSICLNPKRGRRSKRFLHDQDRLYEGLLPGAKPCEFLRRSHELSGNLLRIQDALHAMRVKYYVATKKNHPKLYLWAKDWENAELNFTQERLNSDYSDLNIIINNIGKENLPVKTQDEEREALLNLSGSIPGVPLDFPISTTELERMARSIQEQESRVSAPQPEAPIDNNVCRERLLRHVQRCQALIDARLDSIEAQVAELESQDPSFEDDETADFFPRTKQTIQMLMRDLETMEELGVIT